MPLYLYQIITDDGTEGEVFEEFQSIHDDAFTHHPETGKPCKRIITAPSGGMVREYDKPIEMHSIAPVSDHEISDFRRRHPDVRLTKDGVPLAHTRQEKLAILKKEGWEERN